MVRFPAAAIVVVSGLVASPSAHATYSIAAVDTVSQQVGGVGTSCVGRFTVYRIYGSVPGIGVVHAQAQLNEQGRLRSVQRLGENATPQSIIDEITSPNFDNNASRRQYAVVDLTGSAVPFTGTNNGNHASDRTGTVGSFTYSTQGNILTSRAVIDQAADAFEGGGCDLADRLMLALEAGAVGGQGDSRCTPDGIPSDGAFIQVDRPGEPAGSWLLLRVDDTAPNNPVALLRTAYDTWRATNPCPTPRDGGQPRDGGPRDAGASVDDGGVIVATDAGETGDAGDPSDAGNGMVTVKSVSGEVRPTCSCRTSNAQGHPAIVLLVVLLVARRRRVSGACGGDDASDPRHRPTRGSR